MSFGAGHKQEGREEGPTAGILGSQSVKTMQQAETKGYDAGKKISGEDFRMAESPAAST